MQVRHPPPAYALAPVVTRYSAAPAALARTRRRSSSSACQRPCGSSMRRAMISGPNFDVVNSISSSIESKGANSDCSRSNSTSIAGAGEQLADVLLGAPQQRRLGDRRRGRQVAAERLEHRRPSRPPAPSRSRTGARRAAAPAPARPRPRGGAGRTCSPSRRRRRRSARPATGSASASPSSHSISTPASAASRRPSSSSSGVRSTPTTRPPACAARIAALPVPQATSSTSSPGATPMRRTIRSPSGHSCRCAIAG